MSMIHVTLPDGTVNEYAAGITCSEVVTDALGKKHGCIAAKVNGAERDLMTVLDGPCDVEGIPAASDEGMHILRHSAAHLLAQAVMELYPGALPTIGPAIDRGFYYDFAMEPIAQSDLKAIEKKMHELARRNLSVERVELDPTSLREHFESNPYKLEIIDDKLEAGDGSTIYKQGDWYDLCLGPHVPSTSKLMFVRLTSVSTAYWRGDQDREQLVRIYGGRTDKGGAQGNTDPSRGSQKARSSKARQGFATVPHRRGSGSGAYFVDASRRHPAPGTARFHFAPPPQARVFSSLHTAHWEVGPLPNLRSLPLLPRLAVSAAGRARPDEQTGRRRVQLR